MQNTRKLTALMVADVVGYSRLVGVDEVGTINRVKNLHDEAVEPAVAAYGGRIVKSMGDGILAEFPSIVDAARCAVLIQEKACARDMFSAEDQRLRLRIGVHIGDVVVEGDDLLGDGVNVVARLEGLAEPDSIALSADAFRHIEGKLPHRFEDAGEHVLKNIARPVRVYRWKRDVASSTAMNVSLALPDKPSIAVLPFNNMSGDPEQEYFADGMVEEIITALSRIRWLFVIARNSSFTYKGKAVDIKQVGRELGVRYVLEGSVRKAGNRVRITGQLIDTTDGAHIWADRYDRELADIFALQDEVTQSVVNKIEPNVRAAEISRGRRKPTDSLQAHDFYLRALPELEPFTREGFLAAEEMLEKAIAIDPDYSDAWAALADSKGRRVVGRWAKDIESEKSAACAAALKAVRLDAQNGIALSIASWVMQICGNNLDEAVKFAEKALSIHPYSAFVRANCAWSLIYNGDSDRALELLDIARRLNPMDPREYITINAQAAAHFYARRFEETVRLAREALARNSSHPVALRFLAAALFHLGRQAEARQAADELMRVVPSGGFSIIPARYPWMRPLMQDGLRGAGVPV